MNELTLYKAKYEESKAENDYLRERNLQLRLATESLGTQVAQLQETVKILEKKLEST